MRDRRAAWRGLPEHYPLIVSIRTESKTPCSVGNCYPSDGSVDPNAAAERQDELGFRVPEVDIENDQRAAAVKSNAWITASRCARR
jgi:hypothetical protein